MRPSFIDSALVIAGSMALLQRGHPDALREVQRQMRLINEAYTDPAVLRLTDEVVRAFTRLHEAPSGESENSQRSRAVGALERLKQALDVLPDPGPFRRRARTR